MKRVLHVVGGMNLGGTETMLMNLYRRLYKDIKFDFISYYDKEAYYDKEIQSLGGEIIKLEAPNKVGQSKAIRNLIKVIKENKYDVVHSHTLFNSGAAIIAAKIAGVRIRITHSHTNLDNDNRLIKRVYNSLMRVLIKYNSTNYLACSESAAGYLFGINIIKNKKFVVLPNYIDYVSIVNCENKSTIRDDFNLNEGDILVGHIGRFVEAKNHKFLIDVLYEMIKKNNSIKVILIGEGELRKEAEEKVKGLRLENNIFFLGLRNDINEILKELDLFIFPSIYEGLGLVVLEAQAAGIPCLVSKAIQKEADINIGLLTKLELAIGAELWCNTGLQLLGKKETDCSKITKAFEDKGQSMNNILNSLLGIYNV